MLRLAFDFIITWRETRTRPNAYLTRVKSQICLMKHLNNGVFKILKTIKNKHQEIARNKK